MRQLFSFFTVNKKRALFFAGTWTLLILVACFLPGRDVPDVHIPFMDKWVHFVLFGGFSFLWLCSRRVANRTYRFCGVPGIGAARLYRRTDPRQRPYLRQVLRRVRYLCRCNRWLAGGTAFLPVPSYAGFRTAITSFIFFAPPCLQLLQRCLIPVPQPAC